VKPANVGDLLLRPFLARSKFRHALAE